MIDDVGHVAIGLRLEAQLQHAGPKCSAASNPLGQQRAREAAFQLDGFTVGAHAYDAVRRGVHGGLKILARTGPPVLLAHRGSDCIVDRGRQKRNAGANPRPCATSTRSRDAAFKIGIDARPEQRDGQWDVSGGMSAGRSDSSTAGPWSGSMMITEKIALGTSAEQIVSASWRLAP